MSERPFRGSTCMYGVDGQALIPVSPLFKLLGPVLETIGAHWGLLGVLGFERSLVGGPYLPHDIRVLTPVPLAAEEAKRGPHNLEAMVKAFHTGALTVGISWDLTKGCHRLHMRSAHQGSCRNCFKE